MEIESPLVDRQDIFINSTSLPYLKEKDVRGIRSLRVNLDVDRERSTDQEDCQMIIDALTSAKVIEFEVGKRAVEKELKGVHDWTRFLGGADDAATSLSISLGNNSLNRGQLSKIGEELLKMDYLEQLELQFGKENNLGLGGIRQIGQSIKNMKKLKNFSIVIGDNCQLGEDGAKKLFQGIEICQQLEKLKLHVGSCNQLNAEGACVLSSAVGNLKKIKDLDLFIAETNSLGTVGVKGIIVTILQQDMKKTIERLSLKIGDRRGVNIENIISLFQSLAEFTRLKDLSIDLGVKGEMKEKVVVIINDSLKKLKSLQSISISVCSDPYPFLASPMVTLMTHFQLSNKLRNLTLLIPPQNEFNNSALTLFSVNLKKLTQLQQFSLEIKENNLIGPDPKRKLPSNKKKPIKYSAQQQQQLEEESGEKHAKGIEIIQLEKTERTRGISDVSEALSALKKLEKIVWIISEKNDVSDSGWEMLSRSTSLKELIIRIGDSCKFLDEGLHSLSKITSNIPLDCLHFELGQGNETSDRGWGSFLSSIIPKNLQNFKLVIGVDNEYSDKSLESFAVILQKSVNLQQCTLDFKGSNKSSSISFMQIAISLQSCIQLKFLHLLIPEDTFISGSTLNSLSSSLEKMSYLKDLRLEASIEDNQNLSDQMKLCSTICSIPHLLFLQLQLKGKISTQIQGYHNFSENNDNISISQSLFQFRTQNGFHFKKASISVNNSQEFIDSLADCFTLLPSDTTFFFLEIKQLNDLPSFLKISKSLRTIKKSVFLKLNFGNNLLDENSVNELANSISTMHSMTKLSLKANIETLSLSAAQALAGLLQQNERFLKAKLLLQFSKQQSQTKSQFVLLSAIVSCPNLRKVLIDFTSYSKIKLKIEQKLSDPCKLSLMKEEEFQQQYPIFSGQQYSFYHLYNLPLLTSFFSYIQSENGPDNQEDQMVHLADFLNKCEILQKIEIKISSKLFISTTIAQILFEGITKQSFLNQLELSLNEQCCISGEGVTFVAKTFKEFKRVRSSNTTLQTDESFSFIEALSVMLSLQKIETSDFRYNRDVLNILGGKVIMSTQKLPNSIQLLQVQPKSVYIYQGNNVESFKETTISQIFNQINQLRDLSSIEIDTSKLGQEGMDDWKSLELFQSLTNLSINDESPRYSTRFSSLETALSKLINLKKLTLNLFHTDNIVSKETVDNIPPFGKNLGCLHNLSDLTMNLINFDFGQYGSKQLSEGIEGMINLITIKLSCNLNSSLPLKDIEQLSQSATRSKNLTQSQLEFKAVDSAPESDIFHIINNLKTNMIDMNKLSYVKINGKINQTIQKLVNNPHENNFDSVYFNSRDYSHSYQLPTVYKIGSSYEKEARQVFLQLLNSQFNNLNGQKLRSITAKFNSFFPEITDSILIFLQTLFLFLKQENQQLFKLIIVSNQNSNIKFNTIIEEGLKHLSRVDILQLQIYFPYSQRYTINDYRQVSKIENVNNLNIQVPSITYTECKRLRIILLRQMKRLITLQINKKNEGY